MQETSELYRSIRAGLNYSTEVKAVINSVEYREDNLKSIRTTGSLFSGNTPSVGNTVSREIDIELLNPEAEIPRRASIECYVRLTDGENTSEWLPKGVFFVDTREYNYGTPQWLTIHGYDAMLKAEQDYTGENLDWPITDISVVNDIAGLLGIGVDSRTAELMDKAYSVPYYTDYSMREYLGYIAAMYAGNFIISDAGELRLVALNSIPNETSYLCDNVGYAITFGGDRILV